MNQHFWNQSAAILSQDSTPGSLLEFDQLGGRERRHHVQEELGGLFPTPGNHEVDALVDLRENNDVCIKLAHSKMV